MPMARACTPQKPTPRQRVGALPEGRPGSTVERGWAGRTAAGTWETAWLPGRREVTRAAGRWSMGRRSTAASSEDGRAVHRGKGGTGGRSAPRQRGPDRPGRVPHATLPESNSLLPDSWDGGSESQRGARCGTTARRDLDGGRWVTGGPTPMMLLGEITLNIIFDLGGVVFTWEPEAIIARVFAAPAVQAKVRADLFGHADWLALDRGTLDRQEAIVRAAERTGLSVLDLTDLMQQVPLALVAIPGTVDLLYRLKARGHKLYCLSN